MAEVEPIQGLTIEEFADQLLLDPSQNFPGSIETSMTKTDSPSGYLIEAEVPGDVGRIVVRMVVTVNGEFAIFAISLVAEIVQQLHQPILDRMFSSFGTFAPTATDVEDMTVMEQPVQDGRGDDRVSQELSPFSEALVGSQDDAAPLVPG